MLKSELIEQAEKLRADLWEKSRECRTLKESLENVEQSAQYSSDRLGKVSDAITTVVAMKYPDAELSNYQNMAGRAIGMAHDPRDKPETPEPEELCLLRHLYSLAQ